MLLVKKMLHSRQKGKVDDELRAGKKMQCNDSVG